MPCTALFLSTESGSAHCLRSYWCGFNSVLKQNQSASTLASQRRVTKDLRPQTLNPNHTTTRAGIICVAGCSHISLRSEHAGRYNVIKCRNCLYNSCSGGYYLQDITKFYTVLF